MIAMNSRQIREEWNYAVEKDFAKSGVPAFWAENHPAERGSENWKLSTRAAVTAGAFSPDETLLAISAGNEILIYDVSSFELKETLVGPTDQSQSCRMAT